MKHESQTLKDWCKLAKASSSNETRGKFPIMNTNSHITTPAIPVVSIADLQADPHERFRFWRAKMPVIQREDGTYLILRAADFATIYDETKTRQLETEFLAIRGVTSGPIFDLFANGMLTSNGAAHTKRRGLVARTFVRRLIEELRPSIRRIVDEILDHNHSAGGMDVLDDYGTLIPARTIAGLLDLPSGDIARFTSYVYTVSRILSGEWTDDEVPAIAAAAAGLNAYAEEVMAERRRSPRPGFLTDYLSAVDSSDEVSQLEAVAQLVSLVIGGSDTTRGAIVCQTSLLLQHREHWRFLLNHPEAIPGAVSECLRYEPITASVPRFSIDDITLEDYTIPKHSVVTPITMSALRDPGMFLDPDTFDIGRPPQRWHLIFGSGAHRCLGEALARIELEESLAALLDRYPDLQLVDGPAAVSGFSGIRRAGHLPVRWSL
ncbi:cytochrome P450 [Rhizobium leguminosarum]|uniref:cytochrome P450 n=1 Tax=Rhizobium TaxID=379 RepID=UPI001FDFA289|nr:cytochrome P450 [Rhizobium leguminosarum]